MLAILDLAMDAIHGLVFIIHITAWAVFFLPLVCHAKPAVHTAWGDQDL